MFAYDVKTLKLTNANEPSQFQTLYSLYWRWIALEEEEKKPSQKRNTSYNSAHISLLAIN